jgi:hypothetical protein
MQMVSEVVERFEGLMGRKKEEGGGECRVELRGRRGILGCHFGRRLVGGLVGPLWFGFVVFGWKEM